MWARILPHEVEVGGELHSLDIRSFTLPNPDPRGLWITALSLYYTPQGFRCEILAELFLAWLLQNKMITMNSGA